MLAPVLCAMLCAPLAPVQDRVSGRVPLQEARDPAAVLPAGTEARIHAAGLLTGHARLAERQAALELRVAKGIVTAETARELQELAGLRLQAETTCKNLLLAVRDRIQPPLEESQLVDTVGDGKLVLLGVPAQQLWLRDFLERARDFRGLVDLQARIWMAPEGELRLDPLERSGAVLEPEALTALLQELDASSAARIDAPRIVAFPFQEATLEAVDQIPFIQDYRLQVLPGSDQEVADPMISTVQDGVRVSLRTVPLAGELLSVYTSIEVSEVARPIAHGTIYVGSEPQEMTIQVPDVVRVRLEGQFDVESGRTLALTATDPAGERRVVVLLQARRVEAIEER